MDTISSLANKKTGLLGLGVENTALLKALKAANADCEVLVFTDNFASADSTVEVLNIEPASLPRLRDLDVLVCSPSFPPSHFIKRQAALEKVSLTTPTNIFLAEVTNANLQVVGITGSGGKSTTCSLLAHILTHAGKEVCLVGNIGIPALDKLEDIVNTGALTIMELSSYQCHDLTADCVPNLSCVLSLFPDHQDWHGSEVDYYESKAKLFTLQSSSDTSYVEHQALAKIGHLKTNAKRVQLNSKESWHLQQDDVYFADQRFCSIHNCNLTGEHNKKNVVAAISIASDLGLSANDIEQALPRFHTLPHRLENLGHRYGIQWINDSISTTPDAVLAAIASYRETASSLIVGGFRRDQNARELARNLLASKIALVVCLPDTGWDLKQELVAIEYEGRIEMANNLAEAVRVAKAHTKKGDTCIFSPGAPSYNAFSSFEERGDTFKAELEGASDD